MPTIGLGVAAQVSVDSKSVSLSLGGTNTHQIIAAAQDVSGAAQGGTALTLSAAANASGGTTVYTGTITGGGSNAFVGMTFVVAGFDLAANNGTFECTASTATTLTLTNANGVTDTHAATATSEDTLAWTYISRNPSFATVSATGLITGVAKGGAVIEVSYPVFANSFGNNPDGTPREKIYAEINVTVGL